MKELKHHRITKAEYNKDTQVMTVTYSDSSTFQFKGDSTIWRTYPMMRRCSTIIQGELCDIQQYIKEHGNPYPTAHELKNKL